MYSPARIGATIGFTLFVAVAQAVVATLDEAGLAHIHTIYRDPTNDYGAKFTRK